MKTMFNTKFVRTVEVEGALYKVRQDKGVLGIEDLNERKPIYTYRDLIQSGVDNLTKVTSKNKVFLRYNENQEDLIISIFSKAKVDRYVLR